MEANITELIKGQDTFWKNSDRISIAKRKQLLKDLRDTIVQREDTILQGIYNDFKKPAFEALATELNLVITEINNTLKNIDKWSRPKRVSSSLLNFPSTAKIHLEPYGKVLIISPWNYPFALAIMPLIGAIAAGNTVVLKPSELSPNTTRIIQEIIEQVFPKEHVAVITGDKHKAKLLLEFRWDYIFFTGSTEVGKYIYQKAAEHLTPVTLELGGKSPCIVDLSAPLKLTAKRIVWGKFLNAGQSCIAPDYVLVDHQVKDEFLAVLIDEINSVYSGDMNPNMDYTQIINDAQCKRLLKVLEGQRVLCGGTVNDNYFAPTIVDGPSLNTPLMQKEIFGPILPIISYHSFEELREIIDKQEKPLALYVFSTKKSFVHKVLNRFSFGGGVVNDTMVHYINKNLPFGGIGHSGLGAYHGKSTFDTFSHQKSIVKRSLWLDIQLRYPPYLGKEFWLRFLHKFM